MKSLRNILLPLPAFIIVCLLLSVPGCTTDECLQNKTALPYAGLYASGDSEKQISVDSLKIYGYGAPGDSILFDGSNPISSIYLPFRPDHDTTVYIFQYLHKDLAAAGVADTIRFVYTRNPRFVSSACGVSYVFDIENIESTGMLIDSIVSPQGIIDNMDSENLKIYFRVADDGN